LFFYAALDLFTTCESLHLSVRISFQAVYKIRERFHHQTEDDAADEQQTLLPGHARAYEHRGNDYEQCCHLVFQNGFSPFLSVARTARRPLVRVSLLIHGQG
jgi:hypothetical protein